jgi:hypothetical protein
LYLSFPSFHIIIRRRFKQRCLIREKKRVSLLLCAKKEDKEEEDKEGRPPASLSFSLFLSLTHPKDAAAAAKEQWGALFLSCKNRSTRRSRFSFSFFSLYIKM